MAGLPNLNEVIKNISGGGSITGNRPGQIPVVNNPAPAKATQATNNAAAPANPNGVATGSGSGGTTADKSNDIALQLAGIGAIDQQTGAGLSSIDRALAGLTGQYDTETTANEGNYHTQSDTNENNLQKNKQTALVNAAQGRQGLFSTLSSLGALNGDGIVLANGAVQKGANDDLSGAADNYGENQQGLDTAIGTFRQEDKERRDNAVTAAANARTNVQNEAAKNRMSFLSNLANDYSAEGNAGQAKTYADQASALYPQIASTSIPDSNIAYTGAAFTPGTLANYMAGADNTQVTATPTQGGALPGLVAAPAKKKQLQTA